MQLPCSPKETQWVIFEFVCEKLLSARHLMTSRRRIRIILTEFLSGEHGRERLSTYDKSRRSPFLMGNSDWFFPNKLPHFPKQKS